ncbi:MAG: histidine kinase dimerization/phospho-acceptor domain-containing protein, partial [Pseudomonadota bacterium]
MPEKIQSRPMRWRFVIGALIALAAYALLASVDGLEYWVEITEEYEHLELDELPLIFVFLFGWYAWVLFEQNRERKQMLEFLRAEVSEKELAREVARQALDARTAFFTSMNHDFRAPLNSIIGFSDLMTSEKLGEHAVPQYLEYSQYINDAGTLLLSTVNRMMDISTIMNDSEIRVQEQTFAVL